MTFLLTDIVGSTRLWEENSEATATIIERHDRVIRSLVGTNRGYVFSTAGDSFACSFSDPFDAVASAVSIREAVEELGIDVRVAVHSGITFERDGGYFGGAVNRCARMMAQLDGGAIALSAVTMSLLADRLPNGTTVGRVDMVDLRDLDRPEAIGLLISG